MESPIQAEEYRRVLREMAQEQIDGIIISDQPENFTQGSLLLICCVPPSCQRFSPTATILNLGRSRPFGSRWLPPSVTDTLNQTQLAQIVSAVIQALQVQGAASPKPAPQANGGKIA